MKTQTKVFAFKLAEKKAQAKPQAQWKARDGVATAGCSFPSERASSRFGSDNGLSCA
ncbi:MULTISPECIES: hypothetical protein [unclassified Massilia]|uniref:hypothetical protein n=1 Tax=unclassified Massilia TaxID=2609279 RepID=UPI000AFE0CF8|nr:MULTISPECIES: hypothetical protein [unclassified Massilia]UMR28788.1 hypothetical protein MJ904_16835 [Massilia sp. MB5]UTY60177.1 hypothetical protein HPQ68_25100 [Massilia sp. erpn]